MGRGAESTDHAPAAPASRQLFYGKRLPAKRPETGSIGRTPEEQAKSLGISLADEAFALSKVDGTILTRLSITPLERAFEFAIYNEKPLPLRIKIGYADLGPSLYGMLRGFCAYGAPTLNPGAGIRRVRFVEEGKRWEFQAELFSPPDGTRWERCPLTPQEFKLLRDWLAARISASDC